MMYLDETWTDSDVSAACENNALAPSEGGILWLLREKADVRHNFHCHFCKMRFGAEEKLRQAVVGLLLVQ